MIQEINFLPNPVASPIRVKAVVKGDLAIFPDGDRYQVVDVASGLAIADFFSRYLAFNCFQRLSSVGWAVCR